MARRDGWRTASDLAQLDHNRAARTVTECPIGTPVRQFGRAASGGLVGRCISWFKDDHGRIGQARGGVGVEPLVDIRPQTPHAIAFLAVDPAGANEAPFGRPS